MKLKFEYSFQKYDDRYLAIVDFLAHEEERRMLWVNECGKTIMEFLHKDISREELLGALRDKYDGDAAAMETAVDAFLKQLSDAELLV